ncbi:hypothetical protein [Nocardia niigatensis]|uniref:hypothetical protein n=1 Tax=Nocardia niigatensis TaxID=209249 RepID=UPI0012F64CF7|nr:hypothetical protein [Nocardia niigatensis]
MSLDVSVRACAYGRVGASTGIPMQSSYVFDEAHTSALGLDVPFVSAWLRVRHGRHRQQQWPNERTGHDRDGDVERIRGYEHANPKAVSLLVVVIGNNDSYQQIGDYEDEYGKHSFTILA